MSIDHKPTLIRVHVIDKQGLSQDPCTPLWGFSFPLSGYERDEWDETIVRTGIKDQVLYFARLSTGNAILDILQKA